MDHVHRRADAPMEPRHGESRVGISSGPTCEVRASVGAGFVYPTCGSMRTMAGPGTTPAAARIDLGEDGHIIGLS